MPTKLKQIFVVEDDLEMRTLLKDFLVSQKYSVSCFPTAAQLLKKLHAQPYGCQGIVADIVMPGMNGVELLRKVKNEFPNIPLILITAFGSEETSLDARKYGADAYLVKPFELELLGKTVDRLALTRGDVETSKK